MKLSCSTRCIPDYSFEQALRAIAAAGYRYLETCTHHTGAALEPTVVHTVGVRETFARHRLALSSLNLTPIAPTAVPTGPKVDLLLRREVVMARELWLDTVSVATGRVEDCPREAVVVTLQQLADYTAGLGVSVALANAPGTHAASAEDAKRLLADVGRPNLGVCLDLVRFRLAGDDLAAAVERLADRTLIVRTGDVADGRGVALGSGEIDNPRLLGRLAETGYVGFVVIELQTAARGEVEALMAQARERLEPVVAEPPIEPMQEPAGGRKNGVSPLDVFSPESDPILRPPGRPVVHRRDG
jgi:sugar phosphate isomerase/epimerase